MLRQLILYNKNYFLKVYTVQIEILLIFYMIKKEIIISQSSINSSISYFTQRLTQISKFFKKFNNEFNLGLPTIFNQQFLKVLILTLFSMGFIINLIVNCGTKFQCLLYYIKYTISSYFNILNQVKRFEINGGIHFAKVKRQ